MIQGLIAEVSLVEQLNIHFGGKIKLPIPLPNITKVNNSRAEVLIFSQLGQVVNAFWADNGDFLSVAYTGTGAIKSDVTRMGGKRTLGGMVGDLGKSITRMYYNNFKVSPSIFVV